MTDVVEWAFLVLLCVGAIAGGLRVRRSPGTRIVARYRDVTEPSAIRNLPFLAPIIGLLALPVLLVATPGLEVNIPANVAIAIGRVTFIYAFLAGLFVAILVNAQPKWLVPPRIRIEDERLGIARPKPTFFDRVILAFGGFFGFVAIGLILISR